MKVFDWFTTYARLQCYRMRGQISEKELKVLLRVYSK